MSAPTKRGTCCVWLLLCQLHVPALANGDVVALLDAEARGAVSGDVGVPLLVPDQEHVTFSVP